MLCTKSRLKRSIKKRIGRRILPNFVITQIKFVIRFGHASKNLFFLAPWGFFVLKVPKKHTYLTDSTSEGEPGARPYPPSLFSVDFINLRA